MNEDLYHMEKLAEKGVSELEMMRKKLEKIESNVSLLIWIIGCSMAGIILSGISKRFF